MSPPEADTPQKEASLPSAVEFEPPLACVRRILKSSLPNSTNVGKDASSAFARACGIFIIYLTACANDFAREHKRQTITANDVLSAVKELDFGHFEPEMLAFLENYRQEQKTKKNAKAAAAAARQKNATTPNNKAVEALEEPEDEDETEHNEEDAISKETPVLDEEDEFEKVSADAEEDTTTPAVDTTKRPREEEEESSKEAPAVEGGEPEAKRAKTEEADTPTEAS